MLLDGKSSYKYPVNGRFSQASILDPAFLLLYPNNLPDNLSCNIAIYADETTLYCKCD